MVCRLLKRQILEQVGIIFDLETLIIRCEEHFEWQGLLFCMTEMRSRLAIELHERKLFLFMVLHVEEFLVRADICGSESSVWTQIADPYRVLVSAHRGAIIVEFGRNICRLEAQWARVNVPAMDQGEETLQPFCAIRNLTRILTLCQKSNHMASCNWFAYLFCACQWAVNFCGEDAWKEFKKKHSQAFPQGYYLP